MRKVKNTKNWWSRKTKPVKNLERIWPSYPQGKNRSTMKEVKFCKRTYTINILMLPRVENLLPWPHDSSKSTDYFFPWICNKHKFSYLWLWDSTQSFCSSLIVLYAATETTIKFLMWILILIALCVCLKIQTSQISQKTQHTTQQRLLKCS